MNIIPLSGIRPSSRWILAILNFSPSPKFQIAVNHLKLSQDLSKPDYQVFLVWTAINKILPLKTIQMPFHVHRSGPPRPDSRLHGEPHGCQHLCPTLRHKRIHNGRGIGRETGKRKQKRAPEIPPKPLVLLPVTPTGL